MNNIFYGMLFVFIDFSVGFGSSRIELIPDFIGYILMAYGLKELTTGGDRFSRVRPWAIVMAVYTAFLFGIDFLGVSYVLLPAVSILLGLASVLVSLFIEYGIVMGVKDLETNLEQDLGGQNLYTVWVISAVLSLVIYALILIPVLNVFSIIAGLVVGIIFLVFFNRTRRLYYGGI